MTADTNVPRRLTFQEMCDARAEVRDIQDRITKRPLSEKEQARIAVLQEQIAGHFAPEDPDEAPTLDELRAEREALVASIAERKRAEVAAARDRALADWEGRRQRFRDELDRHLNGLADALLHQGATNPAGLADLYEAVSDRFDKEMRTRIVDIAERWRPPTQPHTVKRLQGLQRAIAELEPPPNPWTARQERLAAKAAARVKRDAA